MSHMADDFDPKIEFTKWLTELRSEVAESLNGIMLRAAKPVAVGVTRGATKKPTSSAGALVGFALRNVSDVEDANITVFFYDGSPEDDVILTVTLAPGESVRDWFSDGGIHLGDRGLYVDADGDIDGSIFLRGAQ